MFELRTQGVDTRDPFSHSLTSCSGHLDAAPLEEDGGPGSLLHAGL